MKKIIINCIIGLIFLVGLSILLYPTISDYINELHSSRSIAKYDNAIEKLEEEDYSKELEAAIQYNQYLAEFSNLSIAAAMEDEREDDRYYQLLNITGTGIMGSIKVPAVKINLPIYHGTDEAVLQIAAGHYLGSSLPIGGESTHAILTGHRGLPSAKLFTDLDRLEVGDIFYLKVLGEILEYEIDQIEIVLPEELDSLSITPGEDYVTLVTCTPYGINSHRMLIRGTRIPYDGKYEEEVKMKPAPVNSDVPEEDTQGNGFTTKQWIWFGVAAFGAAIGAGLLLPGKKLENDKKSRKEKKLDEGETSETDRISGKDRESGKAESKTKRSESSRTEKKEGSHEEKE